MAVLQCSGTGPGIKIIMLGTGSMLATAEWSQVHSDFPCQKAYQLGTNAPVTTDSSVGMEFYWGVVV